MQLFDFKEKHIHKINELSIESIKDKEFFLLCHTGDIPVIQNVFNFDESTILECTNLNESVSFSSFDDYDFISMVYLQQYNYGMSVIEINIYVLANSIILVMPNQTNELLDHTEKTIIKQISELTEQSNQMNKCLYEIFNVFLKDFSNLIDKIEDEIENLQEKIMTDVNKVNYADINHYHRITYTVRKQMRALSYLGPQILINENKFISNIFIHYFHTIDVRLKKQYDLSVSLYELSNQLQVSYDSRMSTKTMDAVNKLTVITIFFGPLTVITGIYGMNFRNMPEINWEWGYLSALLIMLAVTGIIFLILKRKKWL